MWDAATLATCGQPIRNGVLASHRHREVSLEVPLFVAGDAWVMVETKVDLRSSAAWSQFDEAIGHFGGEFVAAQAEPAVTDDEMSDAGGSTSFSQ